MQPDPPSALEPVPHLPADRAAPASVPPASSATTTFAGNKDRIDQLAEISRNSQTTFLALMLACVYSFLTIANTTDASLLSNLNAAPLPIIQVDVPTAGFFALAPLILVVLFLYFHLYLERYWRCLAQLPLQHQDGRGLDDYVYPWLISCAFIRGEIRPLAGAHRRAAQVESALSLLLGWALVPLMLLGYWARYLVAHDWAVTLLHIALFWVSVSAALHFVLTTRNALRRMGAVASGTAVAELPPEIPLSRRQVQVRLWVPTLSAAALLYVSWVAFDRLSSTDCDAGDLPAKCTLDRPGRAMWAALGHRPHVEVEGTRFVARPADWDTKLKSDKDLKAYLEGQRTLVLKGRNLRGIAAAEAFLPGAVMTDVQLDRADLQSAVLAGARLKRVSLEQSGLQNANFQWADIVDANFGGVQAPLSIFDNATIKRDKKVTELSGDFSAASFVLIKAQGAQVGRSGGLQTSLSNADLTFADFSNGALFENVDMTQTQLAHADFSDSVLRHVEFNNSRLHDTIFRGTTFAHCRFDNLELAGQSTFTNARFEDAAFNVTGDDEEAASHQPKELLNFSAPGATFDAKTRLMNLRIQGLPERADLHAARFNGTKLANVRFTNADLSDAEFNDVDLSSVEFDDVLLGGADLRRALGVSARLLAGACGNPQTRLPPTLKGVELKPCR